MSVRRFFGASSRSVLQQVREELGADAVILANKSAGEGVEILAVSQHDMSGLIGAPQVAEVQLEPSHASSPAHVPAMSMAAAMPASKGQPVSLRAHVERSAAAATPAGSLAGGRAPVPRGLDAFSQLRPDRSSVSATSGEPVLAASADAETRQLLSEMRTMKSLIAEQMATLAWGESVRRRPLRGVMLRELINAGFSTVLARAVTEKLPDDYSEPQARQWLHAVLARNLACRAAPDVVTQGGVYALVGPTGVGKTTTAAKIAARCVVQHGAKGLGLITTDSYRVGAHDQLRIYGKILGVPVFVAQDAAELEHAVSAMTGKHLILIDTIGMGQRDSRMPEQQELLSVPGIERLLLLNATAQTETLDDVVRAYGAGNICGAIITKMDEAVRLGGVLDVAIRRRLPLHFVTNGQRVPEDIHAAQAQYLVHHAMKSVAAVPGEGDLIGLALGAGADNDKEVASA